MRKLRLLVLSLTLCCAHFVVADTVEADPTQRAGAASDPPDVLTAITQRLELAQRTNGQFQQTMHLAVLTNPLKSSGRFYQDGASGVVWIVETPLRSVQVLLDDPIANQGNPLLAWVSQLINAVLAGRVDSLTQWFVLKGELMADGWRLDLEPNHTQVAHHVQRIEVIGARHLQQIELHTPQGDRLQIAFSNVSNDVDFPSDIQSLLRAQP